MERRNHNTRGVRSRAPGGYGLLNGKGYRRVWDTKENRYKFEHDMVWERNFGKIPRNHYVHHKDGNKLNNSPRNLVLLTALYHKRKHSGCILKHDGWWKPCGKCGKLQPISNYYKRKDGVSAWCKSCCIKYSLQHKKD